MRYSAALAVPLAIWPYSTADDAAQVAASLATIRVSQTKPATEIASLPFGHICLLTPYQTNLDGNSADIARPNDHLRQIGYMSDEMDWALIFDYGDSIKLLRFERSGAQDILGTQAAKPPFAGALPPNFAPTDCADSQTAAFAKIEHGGRVYIVFGAARD
jgi:hypothetical protein